MSYLNFKTQVMQKVHANYSLFWLVRKPMVPKIDTKSFSIKEHLMVAIGLKKRVCDEQYLYVEVM